MTINRFVRTMAGTFILLSLAMAHAMGQVDLFKTSWLWLTLFVGANLFQSGLTSFCPADMILKKLGVPETKGSCG